jgi:hypothetical protein
MPSIRIGFFENFKAAETLLLDVDAPSTSMMKSSETVAQVHCSESRYTLCLTPSPAAVR